MISLWIAFLLSALWLLYILVKLFPLSQFYWRTSLNSTDLDSHLFYFVPILLIFSNLKFGLVSSGIMDFISMSYVVMVPILMLYIYKLRQESRFWN